MLIRLAVLAGLVALLALFSLAIWAVVWFLPPTLVEHQLRVHSTVTETDRLKEIDAVRTGLFGPVATLIGAMGILAGALIAYLNFRATLDLNRRGQINERFAKAIDQLGERGENEFDRLDVRLGAIYALEQIARDSPELHWPIVEILTAFIRLHSWTVASTSRGDPTVTASEGRLPLTTSGRKVATDVQAALTVLSRRQRDNDLGRLDLSGADLSGADLLRADLGAALLNNANLQGANLAGATLQGADLRGALFEGAYLFGVNLKDADLQGVRLREAPLSWADLRDAKLFDADLLGAELLTADLRDAHLGGGDLRGAKLNSADLRGTFLQGADLSGAYLGNADLGGAWLEGANLTDTHGLTQKQLDSAKCDEETKVPPGLTIKRFHRSAFKRATQTTRSPDDPAAH